MTVLADIAALVPPGMGGGIATLLVFASFVASASTAAFAVGGGLVLLAIMSLVMPVAVLVPAHGVIQFASNIGRVLVLRRALRPRVLLPFAMGAVAGAAFGAPFVVALPEPVLQTVLGVFILLLCVASPPPIVLGHPRALLGATGFVSTALSMFVGATGPLNASIFKPLLPERRSLVATLASATATQHALKTLVFATLGVALWPYAGLIAAMIVSGFLGTLTGARLLARVPEAVFRKIVTGILVVIAIDLLWTGITTLAAS